MIIANNRSIETHQQAFPTMKRSVKELEVDFIGGQAPLTKEEERTISEYLSAHKPLKLRPVRSGTEARPRSIGHVF